MCGLVEGRRAGQSSKGWPLGRFDSCTTMGVEEEMIIKTHEMINYLEEHEFTRQQAEALVDWQTKIATATGNKLLKSDLSLLKSDLKDVKRSFVTNLIVAHAIGALLTVTSVWLLLLAHL